MESHEGQLSGSLPRSIGNGKFVVFGAIASALLIATALLGPTPAAAADKVLTDAQIAEANKPGTVMIYTAWTSTVSFGQAKIPPEKQQALLAFAVHQAKLGLIQNTKSAILYAAFDELLKHPLTYFVPGGEARTMAVHSAASGSGFIVTPDGYVVTNEHVVYAGDDFIRRIIIGNWNGNEMKDVFVGDFQKFKKDFESQVETQIPDDMIGRFVNAEQQYYFHHMNIQGTVTQVYALMGVAIPGLPTQPKGVPCDIRKHGEVTPGKDVAVLKMEQSNLPTVPVGDDTVLNTGDHIVVLGYPGAAEIGPSQPKGVESTLTQGDLSARKTMPGGWSALQTSAEINHGNSGGPAFNDKGEVIGIATFGPEASEAKGINFLVPMSVAKQFLDELNIKPQQSRLSQMYQEGIAEFDKHCYKGALEKFKAVGDLSPGFPFVQDKITRARVAIDQGLDRCWMPGPTYITAGVAALLIVLTAVWFLMRRRTAQEVAPAQVPAGASAARVLDAQVERGPAGLPSGVAAALPARSFGSVQCTAGPAAGRRFDITKQGLLIGRDPSRCQVVLNDDAVSKEHAWIVPVEDGVVVIDRGSANGTFVNSVDSPKVSKVRLQHGDRIYIGKAVATFTYQSS